MTHYKSNVRDLSFNLFEVLGLGELLDTGTFGDLDRATVADMLEELRRVAEGPLGASFADADRHPPTRSPCPSVEVPVRSAHR
ncbi:acyl-CoA dehydrogenase family protein [Nocardia sp. NPDC004415]